eukprot:jgi/Mesvir1/3949/Mv22709-RA.1
MAFIGNIFNKPAEPEKVAAYRVKYGDWASYIAIDHGITMEELQNLNPGINLSRIDVGDVLTVPVLGNRNASIDSKSSGSTAPARRSVAAPAPAKAAAPAPAKAAAPVNVQTIRYRVKSGDSIEEVAASHKVDVQTIVQNNPQVRKRPWLFEGEFLEIPVPVQPATPTKSGFPMLFSSQDVLDMPILALMTPLLEGLFVVAAAIALVRTLMSFVKGKGSQATADKMKASVTSSAGSTGFPASLSALFQKLTSLVASLVAAAVAAASGLLSSVKSQAAAPVRGAAADSGVRAVGKPAESQPGTSIAVGYGTHDSSDMTTSANRAVAAALADLKSSPPTVVFVAAQPGKGVSDPQYLQKAMQVVSRAVPMGIRVFGLPATRVGGPGVDVMALSSGGGMLMLSEPLRKSGGEAALAHRLSFWDATKLKAAVYHVVPQASLEQVVMTQLSRVPLFGITGKPTNAQGIAVLGYNDTKEIVPTVFVFAVLKTAQYGGAFLATILSQWMYGKDSLLVAQPSSADPQSPSTSFA